MASDELDELKKGLKKAFTEVLKATHFYDSYNSSSSSAVASAEYLKAAARAAEAIVAIEREQREARDCSFHPLDGKKPAGP